MFALGPGGPGVVRAQSQSAPVSVGIVLSPCTEAFVDEVRLLDHLRIELGSDGVETVEVGATPGLVALLRIEGCDPASLVATVEDPLTRKTVSRTLSLAGVPAGARARTLALLLAELLRASWAELVLVPDRETALEVPPSVRAALGRRAEEMARSLDGPSPSVARRRVLFELGAVVQLSTDPLAIGRGARADAALGMGAERTPFMLRLGAGVTQVSKDHALGTLDLYHADIRLGATADFASTAAVTGFAGPFVDVGLAFVDAEARDASVRAERAVVLSLALGATVATSFAVVDGFGITTALDLGYTLVGVHVLAGRERQLALAGLFTAARVGLFLEL